MNPLLALSLITATSVIAYLSGRDAQKASDLVAVGESIKFICNDYDIDDEATIRMIIATQMNIVLKKIPTCACGNHLILSDDEDLHQGGIIHTLGGCDYE